MASRGTSRAARSRWALRALWPVLLARGGRAAALEAEVGRLAWPQTKRPFCIGVAGATASGKTTVVNEIVRLLDHEHVASITQAANRTSCPRSFSESPPLRGLHEQTPPSSHYTVTRPAATVQSAIYHL